MPSLAPPANPDHPTPASTASNPLRRSFTLPTRLANRPRATSSPLRDNNDGIETLFTHTSTKIVSFTATLQSSSLRRPGANANAEIVATLPWSTPTERTLAVGPLRIYRVISSNVSFLNSGNFLHTIFPKSQCWCVDEESKFVLRIRQDSYYRIELPFESEEDKAKADEFKAVLGKVLRYEKTPCPFLSGFQGELQDQSSSTPVRRRSLQPPERAKKWLFDGTWVPEDGPPPMMDDYDSDASSTISRRRSRVIDDGRDSPPPKLVAPTGLSPSLPDRIKKFQVLRSVTVPTKMVPPRRLRQQGSPDQLDGIPESDSPMDAMSLMSSVDSFYSLDGTVSETPSPPYLDAETGIEDNPWANEVQIQNHEDDIDETATRGRSRHRRDISQVTIRAPSGGPVQGPAQHPAPETPTNEGKLSSAPSTPQLISDSDDSFEPPFLDVPTPPDTIRLRKLTGASQRRAFSPMPPAQNLFRPPARATENEKRLTSELIRRTCELLLGPPAHLVALMLRIAARISTAGFAWGGRRRARSRNERTSSWESKGEDAWDEDDFGIPLGNLRNALRRRRGGRDRSVD